MKKQNILSIGVALFAFIFLSGSTSEAFGQATINGKTYLETVCPDKTKEPCATAKKMIVSAAVIVTGEEVTGDDWTYTANNMLSSPEIGEDKFKQGIKLSDAVNFWKSWLASPFTGDGNRIKVVNLVFLEVYGTLPTQTDITPWMTKINNKQAWCTTMVLQETKNLNNSKPLREKMIKAAYSRAFGRQATADEIAYWLARSEHFRPLLNAQRIWLYSAQGNKDLRGAVRVALYPKLKREPTAAEIDEGIKKVTPGKLIYTEMVPVLQK